MRSLIRTAIAGTTIGIACCAFGQAGDLDTTFSTDGLVALWTGNTTGPWSMAVQPDGRILVGGYLDLGNSADFGVIRFLENGYTDWSFGIMGVVTTDVALGGNDGGTALALQPDGKILLAGRAFNKCALVRYQPNGDIDSTFGTDGRVITDLGSSSGARAIALQPDGRIVVAGFAGMPSAMAVARYNADGSLDATFSGDGKLIIPWAAGPVEAHAVALLADGRIVIAGRGATDDLDLAMAFACLLPDGTLDPSFDGDGHLTLEIGGVVDAVVAMVIQPDQLILAGGYVYANGSNNYAAVRLHPDGSLDATFGNAGTLVVPIAQESEVHAMTLQPDGKILLAGRALTMPYSDMCLLRCTSQGDPDTTFGVDGLVTTDGSYNTYDGISSIAMQQDLKILVASTTDLGHLTIARYTSGLNVGMHEPVAPILDVRSYPCPAEDVVHIRFTLARPAVVRCALYDGLGRAIGSTHGASLRGSGTHEEVMDVSGFAPGHYVVRIEAADGVLHVPLVKR